ncbi:hypothetical protein JTB14_020017 [Gonioctena quinquepunctata]|nr:hypothetical protein JTB14_020017 [Gonioctena quinquepunctata]
MLGRFFASNSDFCSSEFRNVKTSIGIWQWFEKGNDLLHSRHKNMLRAIEAVKNHGMCFKTASRNYNVPLTTLKRRISNVNKDAVGPKNILSAYRPVCNKDQEEEILQVILDMEQRFYGFIGRYVRILAFELAEKNKISHPFNKELQMAGEDWLVGFRKRHPQLPLRTLESTSIARAQSFDKVQVAF